jgi:hypothetical protein
VWVTKYGYKILRGGYRRACPRSHSANLSGTGSDDHSRGGVAGSYPRAGVRTTAVGGVEVGAVHEGEVVEKVAGRVPGVTEAVLGTTPVGARILLREHGYGRRSWSTSKIRDSVLSIQGS